MSKRFDEALDASWQQFEERLRSALEGLEDDSFLIELADDGTQAVVRPYVQCLADEGWVRGEVSSNSFLDEDQQLDEDQMAQLVALGWQAPDDDNVNWWCDVPRDEVAVLESMLTATLRLVFGAVHPGFLVGDRILLGDEPPEEREEAPAEEMPPVQTPADREALIGLIEQTLATRYGSEPARDADDDFPINSGVVPIWVHAEESAPVVRLFSFVVESVSNTSQARREVELLNRRTPLLKFTLEDRVITASYDLPALPFVGELLMTVLDRIVQVLNGLAADTAYRVGGRLWFEEVERRVDSAGEE